jgi:hypothetical protein
LDQAFLRNQEGGISHESFQRFQAIQSDYGQMKNEVSMSISGPWLPEDYAKIAYLDKEEKADMAKAVSPGEYLEYQLRNSATASMLRFNLQAFNPSEEEFRSIFKAEADFDQQYGSQEGQLTPDQQNARQTHQPDLLASIQDALGPDRFADYKRETDMNYVNTNNLVERLGLPASATQQVVSLQDDISKRAEGIQKDPSLSPSDRSSQLSSLANEASTKLTAVLGDSGLTAYRQNGGWWLQNLKPPGK